MGFFDKLASSIPGYAGYTERERRRETDQALRGAVARQMSDRRFAIHRLIAEAVRTMRYDTLEPLESVGRRLESLSALVYRGAPAGYAGLFDRQNVDEPELDRLLEHDVRVRDTVEDLIARIDVLTLADGAELRNVERVLSDLEEAVRRREELVRGVA